MLLNKAYTNGWQKYDLELLEKPEVSEKPGGGLRWTHAYVLKEGYRIGGIEKDAFLGFRAYAHKWGKQMVFHYTTVEDAFYAALECGILPI